MVRLITAGLLCTAGSWLALGISVYRSVSKEQAEATLGERLKATEKAMEEGLLEAERAAAKRLRGAEERFEQSVLHRPPPFKVYPDPRGPAASGRQLSLSAEANQGSTQEHHGDDATLRDHAAMG